MSRPLTISIVSRKHSASSRRRFCRATRRFSGSTGDGARSAGEAAGGESLESWYAREWTINRIMRLTDQEGAAATFASPWNSSASQSSNSGCDGSSPVVPNRSVVRTIPAPNR